MLDKRIEKIQYKDTMVPRYKEGNYSINHYKLEYYVFVNAEALRQ